MDRMFANSQTLVMRNPLVVFIGMPKNVGVAKQWGQQMEHRIWRVHGWYWQRLCCMMGPLWFNLNMLQKGKLPIHIISILQQQQKQGNSHSPLIICFCLILYACRTEIVHWVSESQRPFKIVKDWGFQLLMKMGRPAYQTPLPQTVFCDVRNVFINVCKHIAKMLQVSKARD